MINKKLCIHVMKKFMKDCHVELSKHDRYIHFNITGMSKGELPESKQVKFKGKKTFLTKRDDDMCSIIVMGLSILPKNHVIYQQKHIEELTAEEYRIATKEELFQKYQDEIIEFFFNKFNEWIRDAKIKYGQSKR